MRRRSPAWAVLLALTACLGDKVVVPTEPLPAVIAIDKPVVQFVRFALGRQVTDDTVQVVNNGDASLGTVSVDPAIEYVTTHRTGWLQATVTGQSATGARVVLKPSYLDQAGAPPDTARILIRATGASQSRFVTVVARTLPGARFEFSANPVTFATVPGGPPELIQSFTVRNGGNGELPIPAPRISYQGPAGWLAAALEPGSPAAFPTYRLAAAPTPLPSGLHTAWVVFESPAGDPVRAPPDSFVAQLRIGSPKLGISSGVQSFVAIRGGSQTAPQVATLANAGEGTFASLGQLELDPTVYQAGGTGWLDADLTNGVVTVTTSPGTLGAGTYNAVVPIVSEFGGIVDLRVSLEVRLPGLTLSSRTVSFNAVAGGTDPAARTVLVSNSGSGTLATLGTLSVGAVSYGKGDPGGWLVAGIADSVVTLTSTLGSLAAGIYSATVPVQSQNGGGDQIAATFTVARASDPPQVALSTAAVGFSGVRGDPDPAAQTVSISNTGGGSLGTITVGTVSAPWISAAIVAGNLEIRARTGTLAAGSHTGSVEVVTQNGGKASVAVSFTVALPTLTLSATTATFNATEGSAATPVNRTITASNSGAGSLASLGTLTRGTISYGAGQPTGWLSASMSGPTLTLAATTGSLSSGVYVATVPVQSQNGGTVSVTVTFSVAAPAAQPALAVSSNSLSFSATEGGANPASQSVSFYNSGGGVDSDLGTITATIPGAATWLGRTIGASSVTFTAATGSLAAGVYTTSVPITSANGGSETVTITFTVVAQATPPQLSVSSTSVSLATTEGASTSLGPRTITVSNAGGGSLGTVNVSAPSYAGVSSGWLSQVSLSGSTITITPKTDSLPGGVSTATFQVSTSPAVSGSPITITVGLTVADSADTTVASRLTLSSRQVSFAADEGGPSPGNQTIDVSNTGGSGALGTVTLGATSYTGTSNNWLTKSYNNGQDRITLSVSSGGLPAGVSTATFNVSTNPVIGGSPALVTVRLTVEAAAASPILAVSTNSLSFSATEGGNPSGSQTVTISNVGGGTLGAINVGSINYGGGPNGWLARSLAGSVVTVTATTASLQPGSYNASFNVTASGSTETITVRATVAPSPAPPVLTLSSQAVAFSTQAGASPAAQTVTATNTGGGNFASLGTVSLGAVSYGSGASGWLATGIAAGTITLTPSSAALAPGTYTATAPVSSVNGGNASIAVSLSVAANNAAPSLQVSVSSLTFRAALGGANPAPQSVTITNGGGGTLSGVAIGTITFGAGQPTGWLTAPASGAAVPGSTVGFTVNPSGLAAGAYSATVPITSTNGGDKSIGVTMTVEAPILTLSTRSVSFGATQGTSAPPAQTVTVSNTGVGTLANLGTISLGAVSYNSGGPTGWLAATFDGNNTVNLQALIAGMPQGTFTARVPVQTQHGGNDVVTVTYTVAPGAAPPVLALSSELVTFSGTVGGDDPLPQTVTILNAGGQSLGTLSIGPIAPAAPWLTVALTGSTAEFSVDPTGLAGGEYSAVVPIVSSTAGTRDVAVTFTVGAPRLALSATTVTFGDTVGSTATLSADVFISNGGAGDLASLGQLKVGAIRYGAEERTGWLIAPSANTVLGSPIVELRARVEGLPANQYHADVVVETARGGSDTIAVTLAVNRPDPSFDRPSIEFSQNGLSIDTAFVTVRVGDTTQTAVRVAVGNPANTAIALTGLRVGTPQYPSGSSGWIPGAFLDKTSAPFGSPAELLVAINPQGIPAGRHRAEIEISASGAKNSPRKLFVVLIVQP